MTAKTVFISSTFKDLAEHRRAVWHVLEGFKVAVRGMEEFGARKEAPLQTCLAELEQSDIYVGIVGVRLGSVVPDQGKSYTQVEYERARELDREILIYLIDEENAFVRAAAVETDSKARQRLEAFKATLRERHTVGLFTTPEDLAEKIKRDFAKHLQPKEAPSHEAKTEFDKTVEAVHRFALVPKAVAGREIRLIVQFHSRPFPASRDLCKAFNLPYGYTVGSYFRTINPAKDEGVNRFNQMFASSHTVDSFLSAAQSREPVDLYARLEFVEDDVRGVQAEFFGQTSYYVHEPDDDPSAHYEPPQGKAILIFSKFAK